MTFRTMRFCKSILLVVSLSLIAALVGCSSSSSPSTTTTPPPKPTISLTTNPSPAPTTLAPGSTLSLTATILNDTSGANWTAACGSTTAGACGTFSASNTASGTAVTYTAPSTVPPNAVVITATVADDSSVSQSASAITITVAVTSNTYVFYASGQDSFGGFINYYGIAGAVTIDSLGDIVGGEQDYNDAFGLTATDTISATSAALTAVDAATGLYTLTITTTDTNLGGVNTPAGVEQFSIQFVNSSHALITQFDGAATSSGSLDLQTTTSASNGNYAFTAVGVDNNSGNYASVAVGGVVTATSGNLSGVYDINDDDSGVLSTGNSITSGAQLSGTDGFGRGTITGSGIITASSTFAFYVVGPATGSQALRIIDIDADDVAIGSAYGQGSATFTNASLTNDVFTLLGQWSQSYATLGQFFTDSNGNLTGGSAADDNELDVGVQQEAVSIAGSTYDLMTSGVNGYGSMSMTGTGDVTTLGLYIVDPALNINDPNNTASADVGGALLIDMDGTLPGGSGVITPQTDPAVASFNGTYVAGFQNLNEFSTCSFCEFDMISQGTMATGAALSLTGSDSDPFGTWDGTPAESTGDTFTSTPLNVVAGIYSMSFGNTPTNPLSATINFAVSGATFGLDADIYQASGTTLYWLEFDDSGVFLGPIVAQGSLTGIPAAKKPAGKTKPNMNKNVKPIKRLGGTLR
jgi:hypothetical protein